MLEMKDIVSRFEREARASAKLRSPHVVRVTDVETTPEGVPYIVMEYLEGRDLESEREARRVFPYEEAVDYVLQACGAVAEAHAAGIVHRDLKPGNLFLARDPEGGMLVKVLDFGISKVLEEETGKLTGSGTMIGTTLYMSPEQLRSAATVDARTDIWALGVILYELLSGDTPFQGPAAQVAVAIVSTDAPPIAERAQVPPELARIIHQMLRRDEKDRYGSIADVAAALTPFAPEGSVGRVVAAQVVRRSQRNLVDPGRATASIPDSDRSLRSRGVDENAPTIPRDPQAARDVTNVAMSTNAGLPRPASRIALAFVGVVAVVAVVVFAAVYALVLRKKPAAVATEPPPPVSIVVPPVVPPTTAAPTATETAVATSTATAHATSTSTQGVATARPTATGRATATAPTASAKKPPTKAPNDNNATPLFLP